MYELIIPETHEIQLHDRKVGIVDYDELLAELDKLGTYLLSVDVTDENVKENKKLVAQCRKVFKNIHEEKMAFKREYMKPLETLDAQVKEIDRRLGAYEYHIRRQVKELEDKTRADKKAQIKELFDKRLKIYGGKEVEQLYPFDDFMKKEYLNKRKSLTKIEGEMVEFFEQRRDDISACVVFADKANLNRDTVVNEYLNNGSVSDTITYFDNLKKEKDGVKKALDSSKVRPTETPPEPCLYLKIKESDFAKVTELFKLGNVEYELIDLE